MSNAIVSNVYRYVIDDVINQVRGEFEDMGIDEAVLRELQRSWETKVARSRVANFGFNGDEYYDEEGEQSNTNAQNEGHYPEQYSQNAPSAANLAAIGNATVRTQTQPNKNSNENNNNSTTSASNNNNNNSLRLPQPQPQPQSQPPPTLPSITSPQQQSPYNLPHLPPVNGGNQYHQMLHPTALSSPNPPSHHQQSPPTLPDLQLPGGANRPNLPQNDGLNDFMTTEEIDAHLEKKIMKVHEQQSQNNEDEIKFSAKSFSGERLSLEQLPDHIKLLMKDARERAIQTGAISSKFRINQLDGDNDNPVTPANNDTTKNISNDDDINSDLDDTDESDDEAKGGEEIEHIILCLYDKVTRTKNKWKCVLKDGIMLVNGRDYLFHRANGDFEW